MHTYIHTYMHAYIYACMHMYVGLEIGGVASQNTNHFRGNCESLYQSDSQYCELLLGDLRITFRKKTFIKVICESLFCSSSQNFPFFRHILCIYDSQLRITLPKCVVKCDLLLVS